jgi:uncharacterized repeat protein (TIGR03833 family)
LETGVIYSDQPTLGGIGSLLQENPIGVQFMDGIRRSDIRPGLSVSIVMKKDQRTGKLTEGTVKDILTKSAMHPYGIKVRLESGEVGRVKEILD